ncbi:MAG TPA: SIMPL domain-containing protein [Thermoanaerobaculia bacterium]|nr:SIMPL domain-containing protein [Thermoanaerobaculia bacterium]
MKRFLCSFALALLATTVLAQSAPVASQFPMMPMPETITVGGSGKVSVAPDRVTFTVGVQSVAPTVDQAVNENNQRVAAVVAALKKGGAADKEIRTSNFSIFPQQDYSQGQLPRILGYQVSNNVTVTRENVTDAGRLLQSAVNAGVNTSSGLSFLVSNPSTGRAEGLRAAYDDARAKATVLAQAAGRTLGRALVITEAGQSAPPTPYPQRMTMGKAAEVSQVPVEPGNEEMPFAVSVTFELR